MSHCFKLAHILDERSYFLTKICTRIFGEEFVKRNKNKFRIIYNNKEYPLKEYFEEIEMNCNPGEVINLKLKFLHNILNLGDMFHYCLNLLSIIDDEKVNEEPVKAKSYYSLSISKKKRWNLLKLLILAICFVVVNH